MAASTLNIAVILRAVDQMSGVFGSATQRSLSHLERLKQASAQNALMGGGLMGAGLAMAASLKPALDAYTELESSQADLQSRVMRKGGVVDAAEFAALNAEATKLGNLLPGTTADLSAMFTVMKENNIASERIVNGLGKATAYFAVNTKMGYGEAAQYVARLSEKFNIADKDAMSFLDTINRSKQLGINVDEMGYAFSRSAGAMKMMGLQGLESFQKMAPITATLVKTLGSGETAGTSISKVFAAFGNTKKMDEANAALSQFGIQMKFFDDKGVFVGVDQMLAQLGQLDKLNNAQKKGFLNAITGGEGQDLGALVSLLSLAANKAEEYQKISTQMSDKASLTDQVNVQLGTLKALQEATGGTFTNLLAAFAGSMVNEIKTAVEWMGKLAASVQVFVTEYPKISKMIALFAAFTTGAALLAGAFFLVKGALLAVNAAALLNPWTAVAVGVIAAATLIISNWEEISSFFTNIWNEIVNTVQFGVRMFMNAVDPVVKFLKLLAYPDMGNIQGFISSVANFDLMRGTDQYTSGSRVSAPGSTMVKPYAKSQQSLSYAPQIIIQGNAGKEEVQKALGLGQRDFERYAKQLEQDKQRRGVGQAKGGW